MKKFSSPILLLCVIVLVSAYIFYNNIEKTPFHGDESGWISSAYYYADLLVTLDFDKCRWDWGNLWGSSNNLHAAQFIIGIPLRIRSLCNKQAERFLSFYNFDIPLAENIKYGLVPRSDTLIFARKISIFFGILCCILVFGIAYYARNALIGAVAAVLLMTNKLFIVFSTRAMADVYYNFFSLCFCLLVILSIRFPRRFSYLFLSLLGGIIIGITTSIKIVGIVIGCILFFGVYIIRGYIERYGQKKRSFRLAALFIFFVFSTIYLLNPSFWPSITSSQCGYTEKGLQLRAGFVQDLPFKNLLRPFNFFFIFKNIRNHMLFQIGHFGSGWGENRFKTFHDTFLFIYSNFSIEWFFLCIGIIYYTINTVGMFRKRRLEPWIAPFLYFLINYFLILVLMGINWDRYYLPTLIAGKFVIATGIYETGIFFLYRLFGRKPLKLKDNKVF